ncbi:MAG: coenzyme F420-0:L-glutamate ligase [Proteobacteria bacterium]|nr:coenzyme F420-0:L-glutamate ligase [Pseudomonadota bacterium]
MDRSADLTLTAVPGIPLVSAGDSIVGLILSALAAESQTLCSGDVLVIAQKIVSKSEGRMVDLKDVEPGERAVEFARSTAKDPRLIELVLSESKEVLRAVDELIIVAHRLGIVLANAGIDASNVGPQEPVEQVLLLPKDPDRTARKYRASFLGETGADVGVIINDSVGRAWRTGTVSLAIGVAGVKALEDHRGKADLFGVPLKVSEEAVADELASAASLIQGQASESLPVVLIRGFKQFSDEQSAATLVRPLEQDLFR